MERTVPDITFQRLESPTSHMAFGSIFTLDRNIDFKLFCRKMDEITSHFPMLRKKLTKFCSNNWVDDTDFVISRHMFYQHMPHLTTEKELIREAGKALSNALDLTIPLWRIVLISNHDETLQESDDNKGNIVTGIIFMVHHAITDGVGALQIIEFIEKHNQGQNLLDKRETYTGSLTFTKDSEDRRPLYQIVTNCFRKIFRDAKRKATNTPLKGIGSKNRSILAFDIPRLELKKIKNITKHSITNILLCVMCGAVKKYSQSMGIEAEDTQVIMPLSFRARHSESITGNAHTTFPIDLPISVDDPLERLLIIGNNFETMNSEGTIELNIILAAILNKFPKFMALKMFNSCLKSVSLFSSVIPWRLKPFYFLGAEVKGNYAYAPLLKGFGLAIEFIIYGDKICSSIVTDPEIVKDPEKFGQYFHESFEELKSTVLNTNKG